MRSFILLITFLTPLMVWAQNDIQIPVKEAGSAKDSLRKYYIKQFPDYFFIYPVLKQCTMNFELSKPGESSPLTFKPNNTYSLGLGVYLFEVNLEFGFAIPLREQSIERFGKSESRDIQLNALAKRWGVDIFYQRYSGFYTADNENVPRANEPFPHRPDIGTKNFGVTGHYVFNNQKFSFRSSYNFSERQLYSRGSFLLFAAINTFRVAADSSIVNHNRQVDFGKAVDFTRLRYTTFSIAPGYTYNLTYNNFFLNTTLSIGPAHHWINYDLEGSGAEHNNIAINAFVAARVAIGYNGHRLFGGMSFISQGSSIKFDDVNFSNNNSVFKILIGYRFNESGILKKRVWDMLSL